MKTIFDVQVHEKVLTDLKKKNKAAPVGVDHYIQLGAKLEKGDPAYQGYAHKGSLDEGFVFDEEVTPAYSAAMELGKNIYISGPPGSGKTQYVLQSHLRMGKPIIRMNMKGDVTLSNFIGGLRADLTKGTYFSYGALPIAMKAGFTLLVDEMDYTPPQIAAILNPVLEVDQTLYLDDVDELIRAKPGFSVIGTGNTGGKGDYSGLYTGTEVLNSALLDRFSVKISMSYMSQEEEISMLTRRFPDVLPQEMKKLVRVASDIRSAFDRGDYLLNFTTRKLIDLLELQPKIGFDQALQVAYTNWLEAEEAISIRELFVRAGAVE